MDKITSFGVIKWKSSLNNPTPMKCCGNRHIPKWRLWHHINTYINTSWLAIKRCRSISQNSPCSYRYDFFKNNECYFSKQAWDNLKAVFEGNEKTTAIKLQFLRREFENLKMEDGELIKNYSSPIIKLVNKLKSNSENC